MVVTHHSDEERISRMHREGKLTQEEADRLLATLRAQHARDAALAKQIEQRTARTRRRRTARACYFRPGICARYCRLRTVVTTSG